MNVRSGTSLLTSSAMEPWTIKPTRLERRIGRLLRSPEEHQETQTKETETEESLATQETKTEEAKTEENKTEEQKTEEQKSEEQKTEETKVEPLTAESLKVPEGFELQPELSAKFLDILNGDGSPQDKANGLLNLHAEVLNAASEASSEAWDNMQTEWKNNVKADTDVGGDKLPATLNNIGKLVDEFGTKELKDVFTLTGAGNHIEMIKFLNKISNVLTEGNFFKAGSPSGQDDPNAAAKRMFPSAN